MKIDSVKIIHLTTYTDERGFLAFLEKSKIIPINHFRISLIVYKSKYQSQSFSYKTNKELLIPLRGSIEIILQDGKETKGFFLNQPNQSIYIPQMIWRKHLQITDNSIILSLSSEYCNVADTINNYDLYKELNYYE